MGRVFSTEQVHGYEDNIPSLDDFEYAIDHFEQTVNDEIEAENVDGALIYGSVAIKAYNLRSDFDCLIVPYDHSPQSLDAIARILKASNPEGRIDMSAIVHPRSRLSSGAHEIDQYFGSHLTGPARLVYGEDPAEYIHFANYGPATHLLSYIRHKKRSVGTGFTSEGPDHYKSLQRILELPLAIGRKTLRVLDELNGTQTATADSANKKRIVPASLELFDSLGLDGLPRSILELDYEYTEALGGAIEGTVSDSDYSELLREIQARGGKASEWLDELDDALSLSIKKK
jgi:hypothetical protein